MLKLDKNEGKTAITRLPDTLEVMNSAGQIKSKKVKDEVERFEKLYMEVNVYFKNFKKEVTGK